MESDLSIEIGDLEQEGSIGLLKAIPMAGVAVVVLVRIAAAGRGLLYTFTSFSGQSDFLLKNPAFVL